jgi:hypothetical protein
MGSFTDVSEIHPAFHHKYNLYPEVGNSKVIRNFTVLPTIAWCKDPRAKLTAILTTVHCILAVTTLQKTGLTRTAKNLWMLGQAGNRCDSCTERSHK